MTWTTESLGGPANGGNYLREEVTLMFSSAPDGPRMRVRVFLPMDGFGPVPLFLMAGTGLMPGGRGPADPAAAEIYAGAGKLYERIAADFSGAQLEIAAFDAFLSLSAGDPGE